MTTGMSRFVAGTLARIALTLLYAGCLFSCGLAGAFRAVTRRSRRSQKTSGASSLRIMVIGTFYTRNWCLAHLLPLSRSAGVNEVVAVVDGPTQDMEGVRYVRASERLTRVAGRVAAKVIVAFREAWRNPPNLVMGYHLIPNGVVALVLSRCFGARAAYQVTGGPVQLIGGGAGSENVLLRKLGRHSWWIERLAMAVARRFDLVVVRGEQAKEFMVRRGIGRVVRVIPGGIDTDRFREVDSERPYDLVAAGRLVEVKQLDQLLGVAAIMKRDRTDLRVAVVGDGPEGDGLQALARTLGLDGTVEFLGHRNDVEEILRRSRIFVLTSRSEGLSIAMAEAMAAGVVPVVFDVGDLSELVKNGVTGFVVPPNEIESLAKVAGELLHDPQRWERMSAAARKMVLGYGSYSAVAGKWENTLAAVRDVSQPYPEPTRIPCLGTRRRMRVSPWRLWESTPEGFRRAMAPAAGILKPDWLLGRRFRRQLRLVQESDRASAEPVQAYEIWQLRRICRHAYDRSPFYRRHFDRAGLVPDDLRQPDDLQRLPTIDRATLIEHLKELATVPADAPGVETTSTGGTSGVPLKFYIGTDRSAVEYAHLVAAWMRAGYRTTVAQAVLRGRIVPENSDGLRHSYDPILRRHYYSGFHLTDETIERYLAHIATIGPCFLQVYPSSLDMVARFLLRKNRTAPQNVLGILAGSEIVYPENRRRAEQTFPVRYFSWYGHTEKLVFAAECEHSTDYHVSRTYGFCELLDEKGRPVRKPGQRGEIVGTGFINTVVPFLRYRTGDFATLVGHRCEACGREQLILRDIRGHRTQELLVGSDGAMIPWTALNMHDDTFDRVRQFQFVQSRPGRATRRIVPQGEFRPEDHRRIQDRLQRKVNGNLSVEIELCERIPLTGAGKTTYVDQRLKVGDLEAKGCAV
jgi:phenylacetate-CoA ligase